MSRHDSHANDGAEHPAESPGAAASLGRKRGSALIITVGTLALIAVIAAFYVTLGQADERVSETVERGDDIADIEGQVARYIAQVIADDRTAVFPETITSDETAVGGGYADDGSLLLPNSADRQRFIREATDYPYTDYSYKSIIVPGIETLLSEGDIGFDPQWYFNTPEVFGDGPQQIADAAERFRFRPAGDHPVMLDLPDDLGVLGTGDFLNLTSQAQRRQALRDYRTASDPWLADSEPTFTGLGDADGEAGTLPAERRIFSQAAAQHGDPPDVDIPVPDVDDTGEYDYLDNRDWAQISNPAPDGLSVNLWNLRGNFDAQSGLGIEADGRLRMSENRTLLTLHRISETPGLATGDITADNNVIAATDRLHFAADDTDFPRLLEGTPQAFALRNTPAWWTMNQRFLYFPADPAFQILGRATDQVTQIDPGSLVPQTWGTPDFPDYQYADADGDGFYDSRWFELKDSTFGQAGVRSLLENETDLRFFVAARVIDLSARVNVNSATDGLVPPTSDVPVGATPAEIDLRRLLTMADQGERFRPVFENTDNSNPAGQQRLSYAHIERLPIGERQEDLIDRLVVADYERYLSVRDPDLDSRLKLSRQSPGLDSGRISPLSGVGVDAGRFAYDALRREIQADELYLPTAATSRLSPNDTDAVYSLPLSATTPFEYFDYDPVIDLAQAADEQKLYETWPVLGQDVLFGRWNSEGFRLVSEDVARLRSIPRWRRDSWYDIGGVNITDPNDTAEMRLGLGSRLFGLDDLAELLVYFGANDDTELSRLERVTQGRFDSGADEFDEQTLGMGPLRATRPTELERAGHDRRTNALGPNGGSPNAFIPDNQIDDEVLALNALNPRLRLTTISGAAPLRSRVVEDIDRDGVLSDDERRLTALDTRISLAPSPVVANGFSTVRLDTAPGGELLPTTELSVIGNNSFRRADPGSAGSFLRDGFRPGMRVITSGFVNPVNNGRFTVTAVTDDTLTVDRDTLVNESFVAGDFDREITVLSEAEQPEVLFQYYTDALAPYAEVDDTWNVNPEGNTDPNFFNANVRDDFPAMRTLAYGYRGSELALRLSAHLSVNMADLYDADDEPSPYTVLVSPRNDARRALTEDQPNAVGFEAPFPWWADNKRLDLGDENLAPDRQDVTGTGTGEDWSRVAYNVYGVEPQPFITEVAVLTIFSDVPQQRILDLNGNDPANAGFAGCEMGGPTTDVGTGPDYEGYGIELVVDCQDDNDDIVPTIFGRGSNEEALVDDCDSGDDSGPDDDITLRVDISPENPDLVCHVLAVQLTNPFDVPIRLSGDDVVDNNDGGALNNDASNPNDFIESVKYYFEYNGHFFPLAEFFERPANVNPATSDPVSGPGTRYQFLTDAENEIDVSETHKLYGVTLQPGESRVFYVSAHPSIADMNQRWRSIDAAYPGDPNQLPTAFIQSSSGIEAPAVYRRDQRNLFEEFLAAQLTVTDTDGTPLHADLLSANTAETPGADYRLDPRGPVRVIPFDPETGELGVAGRSYTGNINGGTFVDFQRTSIAVRNPGAGGILAPEAAAAAYDRMWQEVRLWRRMTVDDSSAFGGGEVEHETFAAGGLRRNRIENDLLVDRLRDPILPTENTTGQEYSTLDFAAFDRRRADAIKDLGGTAPGTDFLIDFPAVHPDWDQSQADLVPSSPNGEIPSNPDSVQIRISNTTVADERGVEGPPEWSNTSQGLTVVRFAGYRRPDHMEEDWAGNPRDPDAVTLRGLLPAWAIESRDMNHNVAVPSVEELDMDADNNGVLDGSGLFGVSQFPPAVHAAVAFANEVGSAITDAEHDGDDYNPNAGGGYVFGFRENGGDTDTPGNNIPGTGLVRSLRMLMNGERPTTSQGGVMLHPVVELNPETPPATPGTIVYTVSPHNSSQITRVIPTIGMHPDFKGEVEDGGDIRNELFNRNVRDFLVQNSFEPMQNSINFDAAQPSVVAIDGSTPTILNTRERQDTTNFRTVFMNENQSLLVNNSDRFGFDGDEPRTSRVRVGDLLLPLAVGPTFAPRLSAPVDNPATNDPGDPSGNGLLGDEGEPWRWVSPAIFRPGDWTTLAEALSAAMGLEPPSFYNKDPDDEGYSLLCELVERRGVANQPALWDSTAIGLNDINPNTDRRLNTAILGAPQPNTAPTNLIESEVEFVLNNGRLHTDAYTPFYNGNDDFLQIAFDNPFGVTARQNSSLIGPSVSFNPADPGNESVPTDGFDYRVGFSVPPAQRLLSMGQALTRGGDPLTTPVIGTVNINTATDAVLRTVPGFATPLQFSESKIDYDQFDFDENGDGFQDGEIQSPPVVYNNPNPDDFLMEWAPGRVGGTTFNRPNPVTFDSTPEYRGVPLGIGNPFQTDDPDGASGAIVGDLIGWRSTAELPPSLLAYRGRSQGSFRNASVSPFSLNGDNGNPLLFDASDRFPPRHLEQVFDFTPYFNPRAGSAAKSLPEYAFGPGAFDDDSNSAALRHRDTLVTNYARDFARSAVNGIIAASERPGLDGTGSILGLALQRREPLTTPNDAGQVRNLRLNPDQEPFVWRQDVYDESLQATATRLASDTLTEAVVNNEFGTITGYEDVPVAMGALDQDRNRSDDPNGDGTRITDWLDTNAFDGFNPITDPIAEDNFSYTMGRAFFGNDTADETARPRTLEDELPNDLLEELAVFNGSANMIDTRSDFYAAWFVLRGYAESDVVGLEPEEPMTPTYEKRFMMIIDRSNVTDLGQTPRILMIREVPL